MLRVLPITLACLFLLGCSREPEAEIQPEAEPRPELTANEALGKILFFDRNLSLNGNQSCSTCHLPAAGWSGDDPTINAHGAAYEGSVAGRFGNRRPPTADYATPSPVLHTGALSNMV